MKTQSLDQLYSFVIFILVGFLIGLLFDAFRISRKTFKTSNFFTAIEDILFWILTGLLIIFSIFKFNNGEIRAFIILGIFIGIVIYMLIFSKSVINILTKVINVIKIAMSHIIKLILYPVNLIRKLLSFIIKPIRKILKNLTNKSNKLIKTMKLQNKSKIKKDFV